MLSCVHGQAILIKPTNLVLSNAMLVCQLVRLIARWGSDHENPSVSQAGSLRTSPKKLQVQLAHICTHMWFRNLQTVD